MSPYYTLDKVAEFACAALVGHKMERLYGRRTGRPRHSKAGCRVLRRAVLEARLQAVSAEAEAPRQLYALVMTAVQVRL